MVAKLRTAVEARGNSGMLIIGRTDGFKARSLDEAIRRANLYGEAGVDVVFVDGLTEIDDFRSVRKHVEGTLMGSIVEIDDRARVKATDLEEMGYSVAIYALSGIQTAAGALDLLMRDIKAHGDTDRSFERMMTYSELNRCLGIDHYNALWDTSYGSKNRESSQS